MTLLKKGWKFIYRDGDYKWLNPTDKNIIDIDCTEMDDEEFQHFVESQSIKERL